MSDGGRWFVVVVLAGLVAVQAVTLWSPRTPRAHTVHLVAPPMAIWDAQGQLWLTPPDPPPAATSDPTTESLRIEVSLLAAEMAGRLTEDQQASLVTSRANASAQMGEVEIWTRLGEALPEPPPDGIEVP